jgi:hypothetical protein
MRSGEPNRLSPWGKHWTASLHQHEPRPVWVNLAITFGVVSRERERYQLLREVRGELHEWVRTTAGMLGVVEFYLPGFTHPFRQLTPASALRPRDDGWTLRGTRRR